MMNKKILMGALVLFLGLVAVLGFVIAGEVYTTKDINYEVATTNGVIDLPDRTLVGGDPVEYIELTRDTKLTTTEGLILFEEGIRIDCDHDPGEPDPCQPA